MNLSERFTLMVDKIEQSETHNDEDIVEFLELSGIQEGFDFCYNGGEFFIPEDINFGDKILPVDKSKFPCILELEVFGENLFIRYINKDTIEKVITVPYSVHQLMAYISLKKE